MEYNDASAADVVLLAVSLAAKIAADLGAEVIKVEPPGGDRTRRWSTWAGEEIGPRGGVLFEFLNTSKKSLVLDSDKAEDAALLHRLADRADAVVTGSDRFDGLVETGAGGAPKSVIRISPFPADCEYARRPVGEISILALSGLMDLIGDPRREPLMLGGHQAGFSAGYAAFTGLAAALASHRFRGQGDLVRLDVLSVMTWLNWKAVAGAKYGQCLKREGPMAEWPVLPCRDGHVAIVFGFDRDFANLAQVIGDKRLSEPRFADFKSRAENRQEYIAILADWCRERTKREIYELTQGRRVPCGPVMTPLDLINDTQYATAGFISRVAVSPEKTLAMPQLPLQLNGVGFSPAAAPELDNARKELI
jgi:crotonobetainyl-CoA:carnitine CoA-transferase CaiB-like acyl-CoA transferase